MTQSRMEVGSRDALRFGIGALVPGQILICSVILAVFAAAGADASISIPVAFSAAFFVTIALEMFRRYVLVCRASRKDSAVKVFRAVVWTIAAGALPATILLGIGTVLPCYGRSCDDTTKFMLGFMFALCLLTLPMVRLGRKLLRSAVWLQPSGTAL